MKTEKKCQFISLFVQYSMFNSWCYFKNICDQLYMFGARIGGQTTYTYVQNHAAVKTHVAPLRTPNDWCLNRTRDCCVHDTYKRRERKSRLYVRASCFVYRVQSRTRSEVKCYHTHTQLIYTSAFIFSTTILHCKIVLFNNDYNFSRLVNGKLIEKFNSSSLFFIYQIEKVTKIR